MMSLMIIMKDVNNTLLVTKCEVDSTGIAKDVDNFQRSTREDFHIFNL